MKVEPVESPAMMPNEPIKTKMGDKAETYNFKSHKAGAGQRNRKKMVMLKSAAKQPKTDAGI